MSLPIVFRSVARQEYDEAFDWYERQQPGLGTRFDAHVQQTLDRISSNPYLYGVVRGDTRRAPVQKFPYGVYYRVEPDQIVVLAVFHDNRDPRIWRSRNGTP